MCRFLGKINLFFFINFSKLKLAKMGETNFVLERVLFFILR
jgi:hypothetical protein